MLTQLELAYRKTATELAGESRRSFGSAAPVRVFQSAPDRVSRRRQRDRSWGDARFGFARCDWLRSMADLEYAIKTHETFKRWLPSWLRFHIVISAGALCVARVHVWSGIHFGLRWFQ